jgi:hypothetical protein
VRANTLANSPSAMPSTASPTASATTATFEPCTCRSSRPNASSDTTVACTTGEQCERDRVTEQQIELGERQRHQALERPSDALAQHRDRRDDEHRDEREQAQHHAHAVEHLRLRVEQEAQQRDEQARHEER